MTITAAKTGQGSKFAIGNGTGGGSVTYTFVGEVKSISGGGITREAIDATHLESPDDFREFIPGLMSGTPVNVSFNYVAGATDPLYTAILAGSGDFQWTYPNGVRMQFQGIPTDFQPGEPSSDLMVGTITIQPSGKPLLLASL